MNTQALKQGDVIFTAIPSPLFRRVAAGTDSKVSHVGIVLLNQNNEWVVAESAVPFSKYSTLEHFIKRSENGWFCVKRLAVPPNEAELKRIKLECEKRMGVLYHTGFKYESARLFCSKFVYDVFKNAMNIKIGTLETLETIYSRNPKTPLRFWRMWYLGRIPWHRITISPASQFHSKSLSTVYRCPENQSLS